jgi:FSR family fosmidomycin resistance protein-like MFS transporter
MGLIVLAHTVVDASQNILPVVLPLLVDRFHLSYGQVGAAAALLNISSSVIQPVFGWLSDRWPTRWFMPVGIAWTGLLMGAVGFVPNYLALLGVIVCTGIGTAAFHPVAAISAARASGDRRGLGMSLFSAGGNLGFAIGPVAAAWLMTRFGLPGTVVVLAPGLLTAAAFCYWRREFDPPVRQAAASGQAASPVPWLRLITLCTLITLRSWGYSGLVTFIPLLLREQGVPLEAAGRALFVFLFSGALGGLLGGFLSDRLGRQRVIAGSLLAFPALMAAAIVIPGPLRWALLALAGGMLLASFAVTTVFAQELLPQHLGLASGLTLGLAFGAGGVGVGLSGLLADAAGLQASVWVLLALPGLAGLLAIGLRAPTGER